MALMSFDLEDGKPPVSFSLKPADVERFMAFMAECTQSIAVKRDLLAALKEAIDSFRMTQSGSVYPAEHWSQMAVAAIDKATGAA